MGFLPPPPPQEKMQNVRESGCTQSLYAAVWQLWGPPHGHAPLKEAFSCEVVTNLSFKMVHHVWRTKNRVCFMSAGAFFSFFICKVIQSTKRVVKNITNTIWTKIVHLHPRILHRAWKWAYCTSIISHVLWQVYSFKHDIIFCGHHVPGHDTSNHTGCHHSHPAENWLFLNTSYPFLSEARTWLLARQTLWNLVCWTSIAMAP